MARFRAIPFMIFLGLVHITLAATPETPVSIGDLFLVQSGNQNGGCGTRGDTLDGNDLSWLQDAIDSSIWAINAIDYFTGAITEDARDQTTPIPAYTKTRIGAALQTWFGIPTAGNTYSQLTTGAQGDISTVRKRLKSVNDFINNRLTGLTKGTLFCDSTFLVQKALTDAANDGAGNEIVVNGQTKTINDIPTLRNKITGDTVCWYSQYADFAGYIFDKSTGGGMYCSYIPPDATEPPLGLTARLLPLVDSATPNKPKLGSDATSAVVLCPNAFDKQNVPQFYFNAFQNINPNASPPTNLDMATPKSATLYHECFHRILGVEMLSALPGRDMEQYGFTNCIDLAMNNPVKARRNPENHVYFTAAMYYLLGPTQNPPDEEFPLGQNWNFASFADRVQQP